MLGAPTIRSSKFLSAFCHNFSVVDLLKILHVLQLCLSKAFLVIMTIQLCWKFKERKVFRGRKVRCNWCDPSGLLLPKVGGLQFPPDSLLSALSQKQFVYTCTVLLIPLFTIFTPLNWNGGPGGITIMINAHWGIFRVIVSLRQIPNLIVNCTFPKKIHIELFLWNCNIHISWIMYIFALGGFKTLCIGRRCKLSIIL